MGMIVAIIALFSWGLLIIIPKDSHALESFMKEMQNPGSPQTQNAPPQTPQMQGFSPESMMGMITQGMSQMAPSPSEGNPGQSFQMQTPSIQSTMESFPQGQVQSFSMGEMMSSMMPNAPAFDPSAVMSGMSGGSNSIPGMSIISITTQGISAHSTLPGQISVSTGAPQPQTSKPSGI